jgi:GNAT superfamily N-acetyltransferase
MVEVWRLVRNPYGRAAYDRLQSAGVTATLMTEYRSGLPASAAGNDNAVTTDIVPPDRVARIGAPTAELRPEEAVVAALDGDDPVGYLFCSVGETHRIEPLERERTFDGAYVRRVFVSPDHRQRGVATALLSATCEWAADRGARTATALVARDNVPSRRLFEHNGFEAARAHLYIRLGPLRIRRSY